MNTSKRVAPLNSCGTYKSQPSFLSVMRSSTKYLQLPIIVVLLFGVAQPSPNFLACTIRTHDLAAARPKQTHCCKPDDPCTPHHEKESLRGKRYLPCCESVVPYNSTSEHVRVVLPTSDVAVVALLNFDVPQNAGHLASLAFSPPPKSPALEILDRNLRI